jgi:hypothetical protein
MDLLRCFPETPRGENKAWGRDLAFIRIPKDTNFEGHDFFDVPVDRESGVRVPNFFPGVSGGAIWRLVNLFECHFANYLAQLFARYLA